MTRVTAPRPLLPALLLAIPLVLVSGCAQLRHARAPAPAPAAATVPAAPAPAPAPEPTPAPAAEAPVAVAPAVPPAATPSTARARPSHGGVPEETLSTYRTLIAEARDKHPYDDSADRMYEVMLCESRGNAAIVNPAGPYSGLFQYSTQTWKGAWNDYRDRDVLDPEAQILATALAWQKRMQRQWGCYARAH